jgi:hypothetical protein
VTLRHVTAPRDNGSIEAKAYRARWRSFVVALLAVCLSLAFSNAADAATVQYTISGAFDNGTLAGLTYLERFTFDNSSKPTVLGSVPWVTQLLSYDLDVETLTKHWTLADWPLEHTFSQWVDNNGFVNSRAYVATPNPPEIVPAFSEFFDDGAPHSRTDHVNWNDWSLWNTRKTDSTDVDPTVTITPEPSSGVTLLIGLTTFMLACRLWRRTA